MHCKKLMSDKIYEFFMIKDKSGYLDMNINLRADR
jgi:hypothetical protein